MLCYIRVAQALHRDGKKQIKTDGVHEGRSKSNTAIMAVRSSGLPARRVSRLGSLLYTSGRMPDLRPELAHRIVAKAR